MLDTFGDLGTKVRRRISEGPLVAGVTFGSLGVAFGVLQVAAWDVADFDVGGTVLGSNAPVVGAAVAGAAVGVGWWWAVEREGRNGMLSGALAGVAIYPVAWAVTGAVLAATGVVETIPVGQAGATTSTVGGRLLSEAVTGLPFAAPVLGLAGIGVGGTLAHLRPAATVPSLHGRIRAPLVDPPDWLPESSRGWVILAGVTYGVLGLVVAVPAVSLGTLALAEIVTGTTVGGGIAAAVCWWGIVEVRSDPSAVGGAAAGVAWGVLVHPATWTLFAAWTFVLHRLADPGARKSAVTVAPGEVAIASLATILFLGIPTILVGAALGVGLAALRRVSSDADGRCQFV